MQDHRIGRAHQRRRRRIVEILRRHRQIAADPAVDFQVLPAFRPDKAIAVEDPATFNAWTDKLAAAASVGISGYDDFFIGGFFGG